MATAPQAESYAARFETVNDEIAAHATACSDVQWRQPCANDGRSIGVVVHHVADVNQDFARIVEKLAEGETYTPQTSMAEVHEDNARHAQEHAAVGQQEALAKLRKHGDLVAEGLRGIGDEQLGRPAGVYGGHELTVAQVIEYVVIGHAAEHLASIRTTLAG